MPTPSAKAALTSNTGHRRSRTVATLPPATPTRASGLGGVDLSHSAWQPCHRQRPSAILNLEGDALCICRHSADAHHHWQRLDSTACSECDCLRWLRPRSPVLEDPPSPLSQRLLWG